jgi:hypothetical protein
MSVTSEYQEEGQNRYFDPSLPAPLSSSTGRLPDVARQSRGSDLQTLSAPDAGHPADCEVNP